MHEARTRSTTEVRGRLVLRNGNREATNIDYLVRRTPRARGLRLTVDPRRGLVVTIPPASRPGWKRPDDRIEGFLREREAWVVRHLGRLERERAAVASLGGAADGGRIHFRGELHHVRVEPASPGRRRSTVERVGAEAYLRMSKAKLVAKDDYGELWSAPRKGDSPLLLVKVVNSSPEPDGSFLDYYLRVPGTAQQPARVCATCGTNIATVPTTARAAVAWTFRACEDHYRPRVQT